MQTNEQIQSSLEGIPVLVNDTRTVWPSLQIAQSVPLGRIEWGSQATGSASQDLSTTARVHFQLVQDDTTLRPQRVRTPHEWHRNPYVYIMLVTVVDIDPLKDAAAWGRVNRFVDSCREHYYEFLIILAASDTQLQASKRSVEKLKLEVNLISRGKERVVILPIATEEQRPITNLHNSQVHQSFHTLLKGCVQDSAQDRINTFQEEITRSFLSKGSASWSFSNFFLLKESFAFSYVQLGRRDLAIKLYDELHKLILERNEHGNGQFCDQQAAQSALAVMNPYHRNYRKLISESNITELDTFTYLFSRSASLLLTDRKFAEVAERGLKFITFLAKRCAEEALQGSKLITTVFRDTWVFISARTIASALAPAIPSPTEAAKSLSVQLSTHGERHIARLTAGFHVHASKAFLGLAHIVLPGCLAEDDSPPLPNREQLAEEAKQTSNEKLSQALSSPKKAELLYSEIVNAAASLYEMGGRTRGAAALDGDAGIIRLRNESYEEAETLLSAQCSRYNNDNGWDELHMRRRIELAKVEKQLNRVQEYLVSCLTMLCMHRKSRRLPFGLSSEDETEDTQQDFNYWINEITSTASLLPRVMRYKADKLFDISITNGGFEWVEGDPAKALVRVVSDLPATFEIDSISVEVRCLNAPATMKSAIHKQETATSPVANDQEPSAPSLSPTSSPVSPPYGVDKMDIVILKSAGKISLKNGMNEFEVAAEELQHWGRYKVMQVALYIGKLKMTQAANKALCGMIVTTKGQTGQRNNAGANTLTPLTDLYNTRVRFPPFYAKKQKPIAGLDILPNQSLYLAPNLGQYVLVKVQAGDHGIAQNAKLNCFIRAEETDSFLGRLSFVEFATKSEEIKNNKDHDDILTLNMSKSDQIPSDEDDVGQAVLPFSLEKGQSCEVKVHLKMLPDTGQYWFRSEQEQVTKKHCFLRLELSCKENRECAKRVFTCKSEARLTFESPIDVSARLEACSDWWDANISHLSGRDGASLCNGGTLICSVQSKMKDEKFMKLSSLSLDCPEWLEMRSDEPPAHDALFECQLGPHSVFTGAFDLLVRDELSARIDQMGQQGNGVAFMNRNLRRTDSNSLEGLQEENGSQEDLLTWKPDMRQAVLSERQERQSPSLSETSGEILDARIDSNRGRSRSKTLTENSGGESFTTEGELFVDTPGEDDISDCRDAEDVVDLSTPCGENHPVSSLMSPPATPSYISRSIVTLRIGLSIDGLDGETIIEQKISVGSLRTNKRRFLVKRNLSESAETGKPITLTFNVQSTYARLNTYSDMDEPVELQYEIEADPNVWQLVGRRRGQLNLGQSCMAKGVAYIIPLVCGRHRAPLIRLFTCDGRGLPLSRYENANEYMQVMVMPCRTIVSACKLNTVDGLEADTKIDGVEGNLPVVIAPDSFFN